MSHWEIRIALVLTLFLAGIPEASSAVSPTVSDVIATMAVKGRAPKTGYTRAQFGTAWKDVDGNSCDTRNDILKRDLIDVVYKDRCTILSGILPDPYSGENIDFVRGVAQVTPCRLITWSLFQMPGRPELLN